MQTNVLAAIIAAGGIVDADVNASAGITRGKFAAPHHRKIFSAYQSIAQTIPKVTFTKVTFTSEEFDVDSVFASSAYTPTQVGYYLIGGSCRLVTVDDMVEVILVLYKNGSPIKRIADFVSGGISMSQPSGSTLVYLSSVNDYLELYVYHASAADHDTVAGSPYTYFWGFEI